MCIEETQCSSLALWKDYDTSQHSETTNAPLPLWPGTWSTGSAYWCICKAATNPDTLLGVGQGKGDGGELLKTTPEGSWLKTGVEKQVVGLGFSYRNATSQTKQTKFLFIWQSRTSNCHVSDLHSSCCRVQLPVPSCQKASFHLTHKNHCSGKAEWGHEENKWQLSLRTWHSTSRTNGTD